MKKNILLLIISLGSFLTVPMQVRAAVQLVKSPDFSTVYFIDEQQVRHAFPNVITYASWYGNDFSNIVTVSNTFLAQYPLGNNITVRSGTYLVKIPTSPDVYAVEQGGKLRKIPSSDAARQLYGSDWSARVIDVPEVFFNNYFISEPVNSESPIPDNSVIYSGDKYFYKYNDTLRELKNEQAFTENKLDKKFTIRTARELYIRRRSISGYDKEVFNPAAKPLYDTRDCESEHLKAAVIFVSKNEAQQNDIERVKAVKEKMSETFSWATDGLSSLDASYQLVVFSSDDQMLQSAGNSTYTLNNEVLHTFYEEHPDEFDFVFIWTDVDIEKNQSNEVAHFVPVSNKQLGVNRPIFDLSHQFGSTGKLKGVIVMGNVRQYTAPGLNELDNSLNYVMHEVLHQWSAYIPFADENGNKNFSLLRQAGQHWSDYVGFISPLGGLGWTDNGNGTFTKTVSASQSTLRPFSKLDLYLMGRIAPRYLQKPFFYIEPKNSDQMGNTIEGTAQHVSIDQIISANGAISCFNE